MGLVIPNTVLLQATEVLERAKLIRAYISDLPQLRACAKAANACHLSVIELKRNGQWRGAGEGQALTVEQ